MNTKKKKKKKEKFHGVCKWTWLISDLLAFCLFFFFPYRLTIPQASITMGGHSLQVQQWMTTAGRKEPAGELKKGTRSWTCSSAKLYWDTASLTCTCPYSGRLFDTGVREPAEDFLLQSFPERKLAFWHSPCLTMRCFKSLKPTKSRNKPRGVGHNSR